MEKKQPVEKFGLGGVEVASWQNSTKNGKSWYQAEISRSYLQKDGATWGKSNQYDEVQLLVLESLARDAREHLRKLRQGENVESK